jgi:aspartyl-tRNA(Asn)/glutamyl-tRNA(Gln) amidotransferase subunit C
MISEDQVKHVARLARLSLQPQETERVTRQLNEILGYIEQLNEVPTDDIEPTSHILDLVNVFRQANVKSPIDTEALLANAPETAHHFFVVPRIVE